MLSLLFQTGAIGFGKQAALTVGDFSVWAVVSNPYYLLSIGCLGLQAIVWQLALRNYPLSIAYFFMSGVFVNIMLMSRFLFGESVSAGNLLGSALIVTGLLLLHRSDPERADA